LLAEHGEAVSVMRAIKTAIDPDNIMNPGKILRVYASHLTIVATTRSRRESAESAAALPLPFLFPTALNSANNHRSHPAKSPATGVKSVLEMLRQAFDLAMALSGCPRLTAITRDLVRTLCSPSLCRGLLSYILIKLHAAGGAKSPARMRRLSEPGVDLFHRHVWS
jgi:hypothetical protein